MPEVVQAPRRVDAGKRSGSLPPRNDAVWIRGPLAEREHPRTERLAFDAQSLDGVNGLGSSITFRRLPVFVAASTSVGAFFSWRLPLRITSVALSIVRRSPRRSSQRSAASSERRAR